MPKLSPASKPFCYNTIHVVSEPVLLSENVSHELLLLLSVNIQRNQKPFFVAHNSTMKANGITGRFSLWQMRLLKWKWEHFYKLCSLEDDVTM